MSYTWIKTVAVLVTLYLVFMYAPPEVDFQPNAYTATFPDFSGPLALNYKLSEAEHLYSGELNGPESIVFHDGAMYTGVEGGRILRIKDGQITTVAQLGQPCAMPHEEHTCGRPLGMRLGRDGLLYLVDAFHGIYSLNLTTGVLTSIVSNSIVVDGKEIKFPDDLDIDQNYIYFTDASTKWDLSLIMWMMFEHDNNGRVIRYNRRTGQADVLLSNLNFPNGIQLSKNGDSLLVCEIMNRRILRYYLKGNKKGKMEVFADNLPAEPDNIRSSPRGYWVAFTAARNNSNPLLPDYMSDKLALKRVLGRVHVLLSSLFLRISDMFTYPALKEVAYRFYRGDYYLKLIRQHGLVIEFGEDGQILRALHSPDAKTCDLSEATEHEGNLYLGSFINNYIGRLKL